MKRLICAILCLTLIFSFTSCSLGVKILIGNPAPNEIYVNSDNIQSTESSNDTASNDSKETNKQTSASSNQNSSSNQDNRFSYLNNGVLKGVFIKSQYIPRNLNLLSTSEAKPEYVLHKVNANVISYSLDGVVVDWITENDILYVITSASNSLVVIDSKTMFPLYNISLPSTPAEVNLFGSHIYISFPDLQRIDIFSKSDCTVTGSWAFEHEISSFVISGEYIYYSEHDQFCRVFRKNLITNEVATIMGGTNGTFYFPKIYLNEKDNLLYIGESRSTGSGIYYYDATTLELKSEFRKNGYGVNNHTRKIFHANDMVFWSYYALSDTDASRSIFTYGLTTSSSVTFANADVVATYEGLFLTNTYQLIVDCNDSSFYYQHLLITESNNVFFRNHDTNPKIIYGVNFNIL